MPPGLSARVMKKPLVITFCFRRKRRYSSATVPAAN
jgi:hypothetical protein